MKEIIPAEVIESKIFIIRGKKVMLDYELANLYQVGTRDLNKAVNRNIDRFPPDFMFKLDKKEFKNLMFHFGTSSWGGTRKTPRAFTEHGILMLSSVLKSKRAVHVNIEIMRAFTRLKEIISSRKDLAARLDELESRYDRQFKIVFEAIRGILTPPDKPVKRIGFTARESSPKYQWRKKRAEYAGK